jgi:hypothetical protein
MTIEMICDPNEHIFDNGSKKGVVYKGVCCMKITGYLEDDNMSDLTEMIFDFAKNRGLQIRHSEI